MKNTIKEFKKIYKKVNGTQQLKQYAKSRVLILALIETVLLGISKKSLEIVRLIVNNCIYQRLKKKNEKFINEYIAKHQDEYLEHQHANVIWICWLQGIEQAPPIVQKCYQSVQKNIKNKKVIVITEENYNQYIHFPDYIIEKYHQGKIQKMHFADLIRLELLAIYGGTWLDSTVYCSEILENHAFYLESDLFLFQTLKPGLNGHCSSISNWLITGSSNQNIILLTRALIHNYWKSNNYAVDYFIFHYFFQMAIETYPNEWERVIPISNEMPHILQLRLFEQYDENVWNSVKYITPFHKLSYKFEAEKEIIKGTYYDVLLSQSLEVYNI